MLKANEMKLRLCDQDSKSGYAGQAAMLRFLRVKAKQLEKSSTVLGEIAKKTSLRETEGRT